MSSKLRLNNNVGSELIITHSDGAQSVTVSGDELSRVKTVNTIPDLKSISNTPPTVWVSGYHTKGDGAFGSNIFEWDSTSTDADNAGTIIQVTGIVTGRYKLRYSGAVNVKWFGAKGTGLVDDDDTMAIQAAINASNNIRIDNGTYYLSDMLDITSNCKIFGESRISTILDFHSTYGLYNITNFNGIEISNLTVQGANNCIYFSRDTGVSTRIRLSKLNIISAADNGIYIKGMQYGEITDIEVALCGNGVYLENYGTSEFSNSMLYNNTRNFYMYDCSNSIAKDVFNYLDIAYPTIDMVLIEDCFACTFDRVHFEPQGANCVDYSMKITGLAGGYNSTDNKITNCIFNGVSNTQTNCLVIGDVAVYKTLISNCEFITPSSTYSILLSGQESTLIVDSVDKVTYDTPSLTNVSANNTSGNSFVNTRTIDSSSGTYTPTLSNLSNITTATIASTFRYTKAGAIVTVSGCLNIDPITTGGTSIDISLPVSGLIASTICGVASFYFDSSGGIATAGSNARVSFNSTVSSTTQLNVVFSYIV